MKAAIRLLLCLGFLAISIWMSLSARTPNTADEDAGFIQAIGWIGTAFWGVIALRFSWSLIVPGTLIISPTGIQQDLGWRSRQWLWSEIEHVEVRRTKGDLTSYCLLFPVEGLPVRLFGWSINPEELFTTIERERLAHSNSTMT